MEDIEFTQEEIETIKQPKKNNDEISNKFNNIMQLINNINENNIDILKNEWLELGNMQNETIKLLDKIDEIMKKYNVDTFSYKELWEYVERKIYDK